MYHLTRVIDPYAFADIEAADLPDVHLHIVEQPHGTSTHVHVTGTVNSIEVALCSGVYGPQFAERLAAEVAEFNTDPAAGWPRLATAVAARLDAEAADHLARAQESATLASGARELAERLGAIAAVG